MSKLTIRKILLILGGALIILCGISLLYSYFFSNWRMGSAPFSTIVLVRAAEFLLPGVILIIVSVFIRK
ncbi:MAG: hypothetical protein V8Q42_07660 [Anaerovoracaceae bacterium]